MFGPWRQDVIHLSKSARLFISLYTGQVIDIYMRHGSIRFIPELEDLALPACAFWKGDYADAAKVATMFSNIGCLEQMDRGRTHGAGSDHEMLFFASSMKLI